jgi:serine/threonine protein kinase
MHLNFIKQILSTDHSSISSLSDDFGNLYVCKKTKMNEFPIVSSLDNKYIIKYEHSYTDKSNIRYFLMKQYSYDLFEIIDKPTLLTVYKTKIYFSKVVLGLEYLFSKNLIHGDIKPENILIKKSKHSDKKISQFGDEIVITDFGSCIKVDDIKADIFGKIIGTYEYCSPEMLNDNGFNYKNDIYSLGIVLCEMVTHTNVFLLNSYKPDYFEILLAQKNKGILDSLKYIKDTDAIDLILKMTDINPDTRIDIDDIKKHPFLKSIDWNLLI